MKIDSDFAIFISYTNAPMCIFVGRFLANYFDGMSIDQDLDV